MSYFCDVMISGVWPVEYCVLGLACWSKRQTTPRIRRPRGITWAIPETALFRVQFIVLVGDDEMPPGRRMSFGDRMGRPADHLRCEQRRPAFLTPGRDAIRPESPVRNT